MTTANPSADAGGDRALRPSSNGVVDATGFTAAGVPCDVRGNGDGRLDLALIASARPCTAAAVFTRNAVKAAPVKYNQRIVAAGPVHGIVANSGNANACTGTEGDADAARMAAAAEAACGAPAGSFFVASTGRIGRRLPIEKIVGGIAEAGQELGGSPEHGARAARAILTSDTRDKRAGAVVPAPGGGSVTIGGIAKGAGMIQPDMATMLAFITTDVAAPAGVLKEHLTAAVETSFNAITVDGDMSTNDSVIVLANGASGGALGAGDGDFDRAFGQALGEVCARLADLLVSDGERITKVVEVLVSGGRRPGDAEKVARAIGNSLLVKTSWYGSDPNWGRVMEVAGYAGAEIVEEKTDLAYRRYPADDAHPAVTVLHQGRPEDGNLPRWKEIVAQRRFTILMNLNLGTDHFRLLANDLSEGYVAFNMTE